MTTPDTGKDVAAICSKCGDVWHVVVAKVGQTIKQVICKECGAQHRYKDPAKAKAKAAGAKKPRTSRIGKPSAGPQARFDEPQVAADLSRHPRPWSMTTKFEVGDRVDHPSFGQGIVESTVDAGKMTVFFASGRRVLAHAKDASPSGGLAKPAPIDHTRITPGGKPVGP